jgi:hypothetical protein
MADNFDRYDNGPKAGAELRDAISEQAKTWSNVASEQYKKASETAGNLAEKGRDMVEKARAAMSHEAETRGYATGSTGGNYGSSSSFGSNTGGSGSDFGRS